MIPPSLPAAAIAAARDAIRAHLRLDAPREDALIERHAATALALAEAYTGTALILREWQILLRSGTGWRNLGIAPVAGIAGAALLDDAGTATPLAAERYAIDLGADGEGWVRLAGALPEGRVRVTCLAGLAADWDGLPPPIAQGVVLLAAHLFEDRGGTTLPPVAVSALWRPWRRLRLRAA